MPIQKDADPEANWRRNLEDRIAALETALRAGNTSIDEGKLRLLSNGKSIVQFGKNISDSQGNYDGLSVTQESGTPIFTVRGKKPTLGSSAGFAMHDQHGNPTVSDDYYTGYGLETPVIPLPTFFDTTGNSFPANSSGSFVPVQACFSYQQHSAITLIAYAICSGGAAAELYVDYRSTNTPNPQQITPTWTLPVNGSNYFVNFRSIVPSPQDWSGSATLQLQSRVSNGVGSVKAGVCMAYGVRSRPD